MRIRIPYIWLLVTPWLLFGLGFTLNAVAMVANGAQMPVLFPNWDASFLSADDVRHVAMTSHTHLKLLCDWIVVRDSGTYSVGDLCILAWYATREFAFGAWTALVIRKAANHEQ